MSQVISKRLNERNLFGLGKIRFVVRAWKSSK